MKFTISSFFVLLLVCFSCVSRQALAQTAPASQSITVMPTEDQVVERIRVETIQIDSGLDKRRSDLVTAPGSLVVKDRGSIEISPNAKLSEVLKSEPNVNFYGGPRGGAQLPQIRGMQSERILILDEGVRQNYQSQHTGRVFTDFSMMESVEVVKGPWSSLYGSGAMGGVVSYRRATAGDYLRRANVNKTKYLGAEVGFDGGSASGTMGQRMTVFGRAKKWEPLVSYRQAQSDDVRLSDGNNLQYSANKTEDIYTSQSFNLNSRQTVNLKLNQFTDKGRIPLNPTLPHVLDKQIGDSTVTRQDIITEYQYKGEWADLHLKPFVRDTDVKRVRVSDGQVDEQSVRTVGVDTWVTVDKIWSEKIKSSTTAGVENFQDENKGYHNGAVLASFPNGHSEQTGVYLQPSVKINDAWTITPGLRYDTFKNTSSTSGDPTNSGDALSSKLYTSFEYQPEKTVFVGWGEAFNAPRLQDLYVTDLHFSIPGMPANYFVPNPGLKAETSYTTEIGTKNVFRVNEISAITADLTLFQTRARDFIDRDVDFATNTTKYANLNRVEQKGYEATLGWQGLSHSVKLGYGQVRSLDLTMNQPLADTPANQFMVSIEKFAGDKLQLGTELVFTEKQDQVPTVLKPGQKPVAQTGNYSVQNIFMQYRATKSLSLNARMNNMWDKEYQPHGEMIAQVGRDLRAGLSWMF